MKEKNSTGEAESQRVRLREDLIPRLRASIDSFELALKMSGQDLGPLTTEATTAIVMTALQLSTTAAAHDAYMRVEKKVRK